MMEPEEFIPPEGAAVDPAAAMPPGEMPPEADPGLAAGEPAAEEAPAPSEATQFIPNDASMAGEAAQHPASGVMQTADDTVVTPDEQKQYDDFVTRAKLFMNDPRKPAGKNGKPDEGAQAPRDVILDHLNVPGLSAQQAIGRTTAQVCWLIFINAKRQNVPYTPDVMYHAADEIMSDLYILGVQSGAIKNPPPEDSEQEQHLLGMAKLFAVQYFGNNVINSGLNDQQANRDYYMQQMKREAEAGELEKWNPADNFTPEQLSSFIGRAAQGKAALADMVKRPPSSIDDYKGMGRPSLLPEGGAPQPPPPEGEAPPEEMPPEEAPA